MVKVQEEPQYVDLKGDDSEDQHDEAGKEDTTEYPQKVRRPRHWFTIVALQSTYKDHEPSVEEALKDADRAQWHEPINKYVKTFHNMQCCEVVDRLSNQQVMHTKSILKRKRDKTGLVSNRRA